MGVLYIEAPRAAPQPYEPEARTGVIAGTVMDPHGAVVPGATVALQGPGVDRRRALLAGDNGSFLISDVLPDAHNLSRSARSSSPNGHPIRLG
jgi:hypothetical protein